MNKERNRDWEQQQFKTKMFSKKITIEFAWSFVKFLQAVKDFKIITTYSQKYGIVSFCPANIAFSNHL